MDGAYDVAVIGGGITGAGVLRDCALRGLKAILLEKGRPGHATTAASTHLIHGGLRYLLYDRPTTVTTCWDSGNIVRIARPLLTRLPIVWPVYRGHAHGLETVETLMEAYDRLSPMKEGRPHLRLTAQETLRLFPAIQPHGLLGAISFDEWWVDPVALVEANISFAKNLEAETQTAAATGLILEDRRVAGVRILGEDGPREIRAALTINASGPWVDRIASMAGLRVPLKLQKGTHLVYSSGIPCLPQKHPIGLLLQAADRTRHIFVVFSGDKTLVGPTDITAGPDPDRIATDAEEIRYLLASVKLYFPGFPERFDSTSVGARPILSQAGTEKMLSREYAIFDHEKENGVAGLITIAGGKMSDFRLMAQDTVDLACKKLGKTRTCETQAWGLDGHPVETVRQAAPRQPLARFLRRHPVLRECHALAYLGAALVQHYGKKLFRPVPRATLENFESYYYYNESKI